MEISDNEKNHSVIEKKLYILLTILFLFKPN